MGAFLRKDSDAEVLVGLPAFQQLGRHRDTATIELDLILDEFEALKDDIAYDFDKIVTSIVAEWNAKHGETDPVTTLLRDMIVGPDPDAQQSRTYVKKEVVAVSKRLLRSAGIKDAKTKECRHAFDKYTITSTENGRLTVTHSERGEILVAEPNCIAKATITAEDVVALRAELESKTKGGVKTVAESASSEAGEAALDEVIS